MSPASHSLGTYDFVAGTAPLLSPLSISPICHAPYGPLWANMTSPTKPEVHNVLYCRQSRIEPQPQVTCIENFVRFGYVVFRRPFVKRFVYAIQTVVCPVLSVLCETLVYCGQTVEWIKMKLGMQVGLGPGHIVLDRDPTPPPEKRGHSNFPPIFGPCLL